MGVPFVNPSPADPPGAIERLYLLQAFWEQLDVGGNSGETTWEELEGLRSQVEAALRLEPMDVSRAEAITAYAAALIAGQKFF